MLAFQIVDLFHVEGDKSSLVIGPAAARCGGIELFIGQRLLRRMAAGNQVIEVAGIGQRRRQLIDRGQRF